MSKVVTLTGDPVNDPRESREDVIEVAERLLDMAKSGEINGLFCVVRYHDESTGLFRRGVQTWALLGRIEQLKSAVLDELK